MKLSDLDIRDGSKQTKCRCPLCDHERSDKEDKSLSVNTESGHYFCHYCNKSGILDEYKKSRQLIEREDYALPKLNTTGLGEDQQAWFVGRGIKISTINRNKITQSAKGWVEFNYYEDDTLVNVKYRSIEEKKFFQHKNGKPVLYGLADIIGRDIVIIVEGEIDKLSMEEAGYANCVSLPLGAIGGNDKNISGKLKCFEYAEPYFEQVTRIIIATDNDKNGIRTRDEIARRFGKHKCRWVDFGDYKDANEVLVEEGADTLKAMVVQANDFPINNIVNISEVTPSIMELYDHGIPPALTTGLSNEFDKLYKVKEGYLTVVTGIPTHGKSVGVENIMVQMIKKYGWKFGVYSPEHYPFNMYFQRIARIFTGKHFFNSALSRMDREELQDCIHYLKDYIFPMTEDSGKSLDDILTTYEQVVFKHGIKGLIIDPWTDLVHDMEGQSETKYIADSMAKVKRFNHKYDVHTWLIAHPTKMHKKEDGSWAVPTLYSISGSANWYNRTDMGMTYYRHEDNRVEVHIQKVKQEGIYGAKGSALFNFDTVSCRYIPVEDQTDDFEMF